MSINHKIINGVYRGRDSERWFRESAGKGVGRTGFGHENQGRTSLEDNKRIKMTDSLIPLLEEIGLKRREAVCYSAMISLGISKVGKICDKTRIPSSKIYEILNKLILKGLVSYVIRGKIKHYQAVHPKVILQQIDERRRKVEEIIPKVVVEKRVSAEIFEGQKALFGLFVDMISDAKPKEQYLVFSINEENKNEQTNLFFRNLTLRRKEKKLDVRILKNVAYQDIEREIAGKTIGKIRGKGKDGKDKAGYKDKEKHTKVKIRYTKFNLPQGITVFRNTVVLVSWGETPQAVKIESEMFASQMKTFFLELWGDK